MEVTTTTESIGEMVLPEEKEKYWIFTFGFGQKHEGHCVKIKGTFNSARQKMFESYGKDWGFQYSEEEWERMENNPHRSWPMEELLEVID